MKNELLRVMGMGIVLNQKSLVANVDFCVYENEFHAIYGPSNSGKTLLARALMGNCRYVCDALFFQGKPINPESLNKHIKIAYFTEKSQLVDSFNVAENIYALTKHFPFSLFSSSTIIKKTINHFKKLSVNISPTQMPAELTPAQQHIVLISKAILSGAKLIILDGVSNFYKQADFDMIIRYLNKLKDISIIYIDNYFTPIYRLAERVTIMHKGEIVRIADRGETNYLKYLPADISIFKNEAPHDKHPDANENFRLTFRIGSIPIDISAKKGEILLLTENSGFIMDKLIQYIQYGSYVDLQVSNSFPKNYKQAVEKGLYLVLKQSRFSSYYDCFDRFGNLSFYSIRKLSRFGILDNRMLRFAVSEWQSNYSQHFINDRKWDKLNLLLHGLIISNAKVMLLESPATQLDISARSELFSLLKIFAEQGISIIILAENTPEYMSFADRVQVLQ